MASNRGFFQSPAASAERHYQPAITINEGPTVQQQQHQQQQAQVQVHAVAVPQAPVATPDKPFHHNTNGTTTTNTVYQLTKAQLSPAATPSSSTTTEQQQQGAVTQRIVGDIQKLLAGKQQHNNNGHVAPTLGFAPTSKMAAEHEKHQQLAAAAAAEQSKHGGKVKYQFQVTKLRSWRTGYQRLLVMYEQNFATLDPDTLAVTNTWSYNNLTTWQALVKEEDQILLQVDPDQTKLKFSCHAVPRACVLTALLECQDEAGLADARSVAVLDAQRWTRHATRYGVQLYVKPYGIQEVYQGRPVQLYRFKDIRGISLTTDNDAAVVLHFRQPHKIRLYEVFSPRGGRSELFKIMQQHCQTLGLVLSMEHSVSIQDWIAQRRAVDIGVVATSWPVSKATLRPNTSQGVVHKQLAITSRSWLVERAGGGVASCRKLDNLIGIVRHRNSDQLTLEYANGSQRTYASPQRDGLIVSILDAAATCGHEIVLSDTYSLPQSLAWKWEKRDNEAIPVTQGQGGGIFAPIAIPLYCLKRVHTVSTRAYAFVAGTISQLTGGSIPSMLVVKEINGVVDACREFNASVPPNGEGLPTGSNEKMVNATTGALWGMVHALLTVRGDAQGADQMGSSVHERRAAEEACAVLFASLVRLSSVPTGYLKTAELTTFQECLPHLARIEDVFAKFWAFQVLSALIIGLPGEKRDREAEYVNKSVVLKAGGIGLLQGLVQSLTFDGKQGGSDLMQMVTSDLLQSLLCSHYDTTAPEYFSALIQALSENYRSLLATLRSPTSFVLENTALLLQVISLNAPEAASRVRDAALSSAMIIKYFHGAIFSPVEGYRFLSRYLCSLWFSGPMDCPEKRLLKRMVPHGFLPFLNMPGLSKMEQDQLDELERDAIENNIPESASGLDGGASGTNTARLRARIAIAYSQPNTKEKKPENYRIFFHVLTQDHSLPDLIWSAQTRRELRVSLETEMKYMQREVEARGEFNVAWNFQQFSVSYPSLDHEIRVGDIYMRLWLQAGDGFIRSWDDPAGLFELLFRRFLCVVDRDHKVTIMCIRCMQRLYAIHWSVIGPVPDLMILIHSMGKTKSVETQHRLLELAAVLLGVSLSRQSGNEADVPDNAEQMLNSESIGQLCQFAAWGHNTGERTESLLTRTVSSQNSNAAIAGTPSTYQAAKSTETENGKGGFVPAVWFVASSSKIPPPTDSIRGPFTVSDLKRLVSENELTHFDLVTTSHAEEYDQTSNNEDEERHIDTGKWKRLNEVWQLRWFLCMDQADGEGILSPSEVALISLKALTRLVELHKSVDRSGAPYIPIPTAKRILSGKDKHISAVNDAGANPLSILVQSLLCSDGRIVEIGANLLNKLLQYNDETMTKFYVTGVFFFALSYVGSNFSVIARLLECSHLKQHFQSGSKATAGEDNPLKDRSFLGSMLPEGLLHILVNYPEKFAQIFTGNADTPEVIWNQEMRFHLVEMIRQHLGDFPLRLLQNSTAEYEFCPIPPLSYRKLKSEIFCHNFYLSNLCDEARFPDWPIAEPVKIFRACLEKFEETINEDEEDGSDMIDQAITLLELKDGDGDKELRRAYRKLARLYHPDRNPEGREMFESVQKSYEMLQRVVEAGQKICVSETEASNQEKKVSTGDSVSMDRLQLLVKAQLLICRRYEADMKKMKYPSYHVLLGCLHMPQELVEGDPKHDSSLFVNHAWTRMNHVEFIRSGVELVFRTCLISPQNADEIVSQSGLSILCALLRGTLNLIDAIRGSDTRGEMAPVSTILDIILYSLRTLSGTLFFVHGRETLVSSDICHNTMRVLYECVEGSRFASEFAGSGDISRAALDGICHLAKDSSCHRLIVEHGLLWPLIARVLHYDGLAEKGVSQEADITNLSAVSNVLARLAVQAIGDFCTPPLDSALDTLFTPPLSKLLRTKRQKEFLHMVNSNIEEAYVIWNTSMRSQLQDLVSKQIEYRRANPRKRPVDEEVACLKDHQYEALANEVIIGGVYIRVFNKVGEDAIGSINNTTQFASSLTTFTVQQLEQISPGSPDEQNLDLLNLGAGALRILVHEGVLGDDFLESTLQLPDAVFSLMMFPENTQANRLGCEIGAELSTKHGFADAISRQAVLWKLVQILESPEDLDAEVNNFDATSTPKRKVTGWSMLEALSAFAPITSLLLQSSCWLELLAVLCGYRGFTTSLTSRLGAARALSRILWDASASSEAFSLLVRFLPEALVTKLKDSPGDMVTQFDGGADTPELIWDGEMRSELRNVLTEQIDIILNDREKESLPPFNLDPIVKVNYKKLADEVYVGGVYISKFLKDPTYKLRDPTAFLDAVLKQREKEFQKFWPSGGLIVSKASTEIVAQGSNDALRNLTTAAVYVCKVNNTLCDNLSIWGYISRSIECIQKALEREMIGSPLMESVRLLHVSTNRKVNVEAIASISNTDGTHGIVDFMIKAIGGGPLHADAAFFVELLFLLFKSALGDLSSASKTGYESSPHPSYSTVMAPSPAPGEGPVRHNREKINLGDDPLAMFGVPSSGPASGAPPVAAPATAARQMTAAQQFSTSTSYQPAVRPGSIPGIGHQLQQTPIMSHQGSASYRNNTPTRPSLPSFQEQQTQPAATKEDTAMSTPLHQQQQQNSHRQQSFSPRMTAPRPYEQQRSTTQQYQAPHFSSQQPQSASSQNQQFQSQFSARQSPQIQNQQYQSHQAVPQAQQQAHFQNQGFQPKLATHMGQQAQYQDGRFRPQPTATVVQQRSLPQQNHPPPPTPRAYSQAAGLASTCATPVAPQAYRSTAAPSSFESGNARTSSASQWSAPAHPNSGLVQQQQLQVSGAEPPSPNMTSAGNPTSEVSHPSDDNSSMMGVGSLPRAPPPAAPPPPPPPVVETVPHQGNAMSTMTSVGQGGIIDARSPTDPTVTAEERALATDGAPGAAHGRVTLLHQALKCQLCQFLVNDFLENVSLDEIKDPAAGKVHAINLLKLLTADPGYGMKFKLILKEIPAWTTKYKSQDHSLLLATTKRPNYFLTAGEEANQTLMLTEGTKDDENNDQDSEND